jgi:hypothetical protein
MESLVKVINREAHNTYHDRRDLLETIFDLLLSEPDRSYLMRIVSEKAGVRTTTLYSWRKRVKADPTWRLSRDLFSENLRIFPDDVKQTIASFLRVGFLAPCTN